MPHRARILVVDDHREIRHIAQVLLSAAGHQVETADSVLEGIEVARRFQPQFVLCDLRFETNQTGYDFARAIRAEPTSLAQSVLFAVTGFANSKDSVEALQAGFDEVWIKPIDYNALIERIAALELPRTARSNS